MFDHLTGPVAAGTALMLSAAVAGLLLYRWRQRQMALRSMRAPSQWPIMARELVTPDEHVVWQWLCDVFADYAVMLKIPLLRYIALSTPADSAVWHKRLSGVYCTFTVCNAEGTVIGCVDYVEADGSDHAHCYLKESILGKCGIPYVMAGPRQLPAAEKLRRVFIGEIELSGPDMTGPGAPDSLAGVALELTAAEPLAPSSIDRARSDLQSSLEHRRRQRSVPPGGTPEA